MKSATPWNILLIADEPSARDQFRALASASETSGRDHPIQLDVTHPREAVAKIIAARDTLTPCYLAIIDANIQPGDCVTAAVDLLRADPDICILLSARDSNELRQRILEQINAAERLWQVPGGHDAAQVEQMAIALCKNRQLQSTLTAERRQFADALQSSQDRYSLAVAGSNDGIWDWNVETGLVFYSPRWKEILGFAEAEVTDSLDEWMNRIHPEDLTRVREDVDAHFKGVTEKFQCEYRMLHKNGSYHWMLTRGVAVRSADGKVLRAAGSQTEITDRKLAEEQLRHDALHDALTGLANRALLLDRISNCMKRAARSPSYGFAILFLDVDRFKVINDSLGHDAGDQLLVEIATRIMTVVRTLDTVARLEMDHFARLGGDEFVLLLDSVQIPDGAVRVAQRLLAAMNDSFRFGRHEVFASISMGVAFGNAATQRPEDILRDADAALHDAKNDHKQRYRIYNPEMHARAMRRLSVEAELRQAVDRGELALSYQPIHSLSTGRVVEFEALIRWEHPQRGLIMPQDFVPIAEETSLVIPVGAWVLRNACLQFALWAQQHPGMEDVGVAVNVSGRQFANPELVSDIKKSLTQSGLSPRRLSLEITETAIMESGTHVHTMLPELHDLGAKLHLDDFGTGYSSLGYLNQMPFDVVKIDRSFISGLCTGKTGRSLVQAIIAMARSMDMEAIAEGVESESQLSILTGMGCDCVQGFYFAPPLPADDAFNYFKRQYDSANAAKKPGFRVA